MGQRQTTATGSSNIPSSMSMGADIGGRGASSTATSQQQQTTALPNGTTTTTAANNNVTSSSSSSSNSSSSSSSNSNNNSTGNFFSNFFSQSSSSTANGYPTRSSANNNNNQRRSGNNQRGASHFRHQISVPNENAISSSSSNTLVPSPSADLIGTAAATGASSSSTNLSPRSRLRNNAFDNSADLFYRLFHSSSSSSQQQQQQQQQGSDANASSSSNNTTSGLNAFRFFNLASAFGVNSSNNGNNINDLDSDLSSDDDESHWANTMPYVFALRDFKCFVCKKSIPPYDIEAHMMMCLTKPRITYNDDVLTDDKGECIICLENLEKGQTIARLPCLCIYHKHCIDKWLQRSQSCPGHPPD